MGIFKAMPYKFVIKRTNPIENVCFSKSASKKRCFTLADRIGADNSCAHLICKSYANTPSANPAYLPALTLHVKERYDSLLIARIEHAVKQTVVSACIDFAREWEIRRFGDRAYWKCDQQTVVSTRPMAFLYRVNLNRSNRNYKHVALLRYFLWFLVLCKNKDINVKQLSWSSLPCIFLTMKVLQGLGQNVAIKGKTFRSIFS